MWPDSWWQLSYFSIAKYVQVCNIGIKSMADWKTCLKLPRLHICFNFLSKFYSLFLSNNSLHVCHGSTSDLKNYTYLF